ncbi:response regulator [Nonomuraea sp. NPDC002799]
MDGRNRGRQIIAGAPAPRRPPVTRILIAEDMDDLRDTLVALLELEEDFLVVAALASGERIVPAGLAHHPDVAVIDIDLPVVDGLTAAAELRRRLPTCRVLILTGLPRAGCRGLAAAAGASGFLTKDGPADLLIDAIRRIAVGEQLLRDA